MNYAHDGKFSVKKASGIGLTVALHALVACGVLYGLQRTFIHPAPPPEIILTPPEQSHPKTQVESKPAEPGKQQVVVPTLSTPLIEIKKDTAPPTAFVDNTDKKPGPEKTGDKIAEGSGGGGETKTGTPVSSPVITNLDSCKPEYPRSSLLNEETGTVRVRFEIGADSKLVAASVLHSSGHTLLDRAAVNALSHCQFKAAQQDGVPVSSSLVTEYVWKLAND
jgi:protein TonB